MPPNISTKSIGSATTRIAGNNHQSTDPLIGTLIEGRYTILEELGSGGMGVVYRAHHERISKDVAVKVLLAELTQEEQAVVRFKREAQAACQLEGTHCVRVTDFGQLEDGRSYLAMDLIQGQSFDDYLTEHPKMPITEMVDLTLQICRGLMEAHELGIVHRDLKPSNIMLTDRYGEPVVKILDFSIAKLANLGPEEQQLTKTGMVFGTPIYLSPEQALGGSIDNRTDIYSLGVICYQMLAGRVPFESETAMGLLGQHLHDKPPPISRSRPDVPARLEQIVMRCLAKKPDTRFSNVQELYQELLVCRPASDDSADTSMPAVLASFSVGKLLKELVRRAAKRPKLTAGIAGGIVLLIILLASLLGGDPHKTISTDSSPDKSAAVQTQTEQGGGGESSPSQSQSADPLQPEMDELKGLLSRGEADRALKKLRRLVKAHPQHAQLFLLLGYASSVQDLNKEAYQAYEVALTLQPDLVTDSFLHQRLIHDLDGENYGLATALLETRVRHAAIEALVTATGDRRFNVRHRSAEMLEKLGQGFRVDNARLYGLDLENATKEWQIRKILSKLKELKDRTAVPYLQRAQKKWQGSAVVVDINQTIKALGGDVEEKAPIR